MKKVTGLIYLGIFLVVLLVPLFLTNTKENVVSEIDNRKLVERPVFGTDGYTNASETYLQERIGLRNEMVSAYAVLNDVGTGELTHPVYTYGQDGYVFFNMYNNIKYSDYHKSFAEMVFKMQEYCESRGTKFYFMFEPEKKSVLRRYLPEGVNYDDSWVDEMLSYMQEMGIHCINNKELLTEKSNEEVVFNKQFDAGHWNDLGCFYATNHLFQRIHEDIPEVTEMTLDEFNIETVVETTLPISEFKIHEEVPKFTIKIPYTSMTNLYADEIERNYNYRYFHYLENNAANSSTLPKTLFFQGSYYNRNENFFVSRTSVDIAVHNYQNVMNLDYYYNLFQPDVIVLEVAEYTLTDQYFDSKEMSNIDWNPALLGTETGQTYTEQMTTLLNDTDLFQVEAKVNLVEKSMTDDIYINREFADAQYAYLITDKRVIDLRKNSVGLLSASIMHEEILSGENLILYIVDYDGKSYYCPLSVEIVSNIENNLTFSENVQKDEENHQYIYKSVDKKNQFYTFVLQILDAETNEYLGNISEKSDSGDLKGKYTHDRSSGWYKLRLKTNGNLKDEYMEYLIYLVEGEIYYYYYDIESISAKEAIVNQFEVFGN